MVTPAVIIAVATPIIESKIMVGLNRQLMLVVLVREQGGSDAICLTRHERRGVQPQRVD